MKKVYAVSLASFFLLASCGGDAKKDNNQSSTEPKEEALKPSEVEHALIAKSSSATWERKLREAATKKKVKLFGADVDMEIGEVNLTTQGKASIKSGSLVTLEDNYQQMSFVFDMTTFKFNEDMKDKKDDLFKAKSYPESALKFNTITKSGDGYTLKGKLTIAKTAKPVVCSGNFTVGATGTTFEGKLSINTLDYPLRDKDAEKSTLEDKVTVDLKLVFQK